MSNPATTSQTVGPYFQIGLSPRYHHDLTGDAVSGERITIQGQVLDGEGKPVPDAVLEIWQANSQGKYFSVEEAGKSELKEGFLGFGRIPTDENGAFLFSTIKPGSVPAPDGSQQAPHIVVSVFMRGLLTRLVSRIYFSDEQRNVGDFILKQVDAKRRATLLAIPVAGREGTLGWNIILQGKNETVFFDF
jgi:protocatechuate 3,4-dioxygenase alpha subunit